MLEHPKIAKIEDDVKLYAISRNCVGIVKTNNDFYIYGHAKDNHFDPIEPDENLTTRYKIKLPDELAADQIKHIDMGHNFTVFSTESGSLYAMGDLFTIEFAVNKGEENQTEGGNENKVKKIKLPSGCKANRVWCSKQKTQKVVIVEVEDSNKKKYLASIGRDFGSGLLGQGSSVSESLTL